MSDEYGNNKTLEDVQTKSDERRVFDRSRLLIDVFFNGEDATGVASTKDLSLGGLYMNTQTVLPQGAMLSIRIPLGGENQIVAKAEVVYVNEGRGVGVRFKDLSEEDKKLLERAIKLT